jgi:hypothetical protein
MAASERSNKERASRIAVAFLAADDAAIAAAGADTADSLPVAFSSSSSFAELAVVVAVP